MNNTAALKDFISSHKLSNQHSVVYFTALITVKTEKNKITNQKMQVRVNFEGYNNYGTLFFVHDDLDPLIYPTVFEARWQEMHHIENEYLLIKGKHTQNSDIGNYTVKIFPLNTEQD